MIARGFNIESKIGFRMREYYQDLTLSPKPHSALNPTGALIYRSLRGAPVKVTGTLIGLLPSMLNVPAQRFGSCEPSAETDVVPGKGQICDKFQGLGFRVWALGFGV